LSDADAKRDVRSECWVRQSLVCGRSYGPLKDKQFIQGFIADSYIDIQSARLMTIHVAEKIDECLDAGWTDISAIKVAVPAASAGGGPGHPGVGCGRDHQRPTAGRHVHGRQDPANR
jgi:hypothetical protein